MLDPEKWDLDGVYMIDGNEVPVKEHLLKGMEISLACGQALVKRNWCPERMKLIHDLITNPYKDDVEE